MTGKSWAIFALTSTVTAVFAIDFSIRETTSIYQVGQVTNKERDTGEHRELQAYGEQHTVTAGLGNTASQARAPSRAKRDGLARAQEAEGPKWRSQGPLPAERGERAVQAGSARADPRRRGADAARERRQK